MRDALRSAADDHPAAAEGIQGDLSRRAAQLEAGMEAARSTNISVARAKKLLKELQAQAAAAGAALELRAACDRFSGDTDELTVNSRTRGLAHFRRDF